MVKQLTLNALDRQVTAGLRRGIQALLAVWVVSVVMTVPVEGSQFEDFLRFVELGKSSGKVETSIVSYRDLRGVEVQLIGAVHVGESEYYKKLEERFASLDVLLYEMVKPRDADPSQLQTSQSGVSLLQRTMKNVLKLEFQLDAIDYSAANFVHADMTPEEFEKAQDAKGESLSGLMLKTMMEQQAATSPGDSIRENLRFLAALTNPNRSRALKLFMGRQIGEMEKAVIGLGEDKDGNQTGSVLLQGRNEVAMRVLTEHLNTFRHRRIGIFYGAAHMPDLESRLLKLGFRKVRSEWLTAWDMTGD